MVASHCAGDDGNSAVLGWYDTALWYVSLSSLDEAPEGYAYLFRNADVERLGGSVN